MQSFETFLSDLFDPPLPSDGVDEQVIIEADADIASA